VALEVPHGCTRFCEVPGGCPRPTEVPGACPRTGEVGGGSSLYGGSGQSLGLSTSKAGARASIAPGRGAAVSKWVDNSSSCSISETWWDSSHAGMLS